MIDCVKKQLLFYKNAMRMPMMRPKKEEANNIKASACFMLRLTVLVGTVATSIYRIGRLMRTNLDRRLDAQNFFFTCV